MGQKPSPSTHQVQPNAKKTPNKATSTWTRPNHQRTTHATGSKVKLSRSINIGKSVSLASSGTRHNVHHHQQFSTEKIGLPLESPLKAGLSKTGTTC
ncbi:hypothetical protein HN873_014343 [Arachis hypogaea]